MLKKIATTAISALALLFAPLLFLHATTPIETVATARPADRAVIFGAVVRGGQISPLHADRLDTAIALWRAGKAPELVVSNAARAAQAMRAYLLRRGVPAGAIVVDGKAPSTPDTCVNQRSQPGARLILISQRFHLPRLALQCARRGITGQYIPAQHRTHATISPARRWSIRIYRQAREAVLVWLELLGLYDLLRG